jgi:2-iminobutanoate/2-iminopropanoate deaminase
MSREYVTGDREQARAYSRAVKVKGGTTVYLAGIGGDADAEGRSLAGDFAGQVHRVFGRMAEVMAQAGGSLDDLVTMTVFITDPRHGDEFIEIRKQYFPRGFPASALIGCDSLARPTMLVEVQAIAVLAD